MAKKLLALLIAVMMIVPSILVPAYADVSYTAAKHFDSTTGHGYSQIPNGHYPDKAYHLMTRVVIEYLDVGNEGGHGSISWVNGSPNSAYGFDFWTGKAFVAMAGWNGQVNDNTNFLAEEDYVLEEGEYYQFDWYVSATEIKGYVNGDLVIDYVGSGLWSAGGYIISYPNTCGYDVLDYVVTAADDSATYCANLAGWSFSEGDGTAGWSDVEVDYTVDTYEIIDYQPYADAVIEKINAIGNVGYNEWVSYTDTNAFLREAGSNWGTYDDVQRNINNPSKIEIDVQVAENLEGVSLIGGDPIDGGGAYLGYNIDTQKFFIAPGCGNNGHENTYANAAVVSDGTYPLDSSRLYTIGLVYGSNYVAVEFQGKEIIRSTNYSFVSGHFMFGASNSTLHIFEWRVYLLSSGALASGPKDWSDHSANGTAAGGYTFTADKFVNSGAAIAEAEAAYAAIPAQAQTLVTNYNTLTAARATYDAKVQAVAQTEANAVIDQINAIGEVTLDDANAIQAAEDAYANLDPVVQALVNNYETLTAARAAYNTIVSNVADYNKLVNRIGTVVYQGEGNRDSDYVALGFQGKFDMAGGSDGYSNQKVNGQTTLVFDYRMKFDFQVVDWDDTTDYAQLAGGAQNFCVGYDFPTQRFVLIMEEGHGGDHSPWTNLDPEDANAISVSDVFPIQKGAVYTWDLQVKGNRVTLYIDGVKMVELANGTTENTCRKDGNYFIFYPRYCVVNFTNYVWNLDLGAGWQNWEDECPLYGQDLINSVTWGGRSGSYGSSVIEIFEQGPNDSDHTIAAAEAKYETLTAYEKTQVADAYATMTAARATYANYANDPAVGAVIAAIDELGEITLASGDAIVAAETAYAALTAAQKEEVSNYATLTAARATYNALVKARDDAAAAAVADAAIDAIGTVYYQYDQSAVADELGILTNFVNQNDMGAYSHVNSSDMDADFTIEYDFRPISNYDTANAFMGFGCNNGVGAGYSYSEQKWFITSSAKLFEASARQLDVTSAKFALNPDKVYHVKFDMSSSESAVYVDGVKVVSSTSLVKGNGYCIFMPQGCSYKMSNLTITKGGVTLLDGAKGQDLVNQTVFPLAANYNTAGVVSMDAPATIDSGDAISAARAAYEALTADQKALVSNLAVLTAAEARYAELATPVHVHDYVAVVTAPTCTEAGYTTYTCSGCDDSYVADQVPALGHNFVNGVCTRCSAVDPNYDPAVITLESAEIAVGSTAVIELDLSNNPGISGIVMTITPDEALNITNVANGGLFDALTPGANLLFDNSTDVTVDGTIARITVEVPEGTALGDYTITVTVWQASNSDLEDVDCISVDATITVVEQSGPAYQYGDANGDGVVNSLDIIQLYKYIDKPAEVVIYNGDANGDGVVNSLDIIKLYKYIDKPAEVILGQQ